MSKILREIIKPTNVPNTEKNNSITNIWIKIINILNVPKYSWFNVHVIIIEKKNWIRPNIIPLNEIAINSSKLEIGAFRSAWIWFVS